MVVDRLGDSSTLSNSTISSFSTRMPNGIHIQAECLCIVSVLDSGGEKRFRRTSNHEPGIVCTPIRAAPAQGAGGPRWHDQSRDPKARQTPSSCPPWLCPPSPGRQRFEWRTLAITGPPERIRHVKVPGRRLRVHCLVLPVRHRRVTRRPFEVAAQ